MESTSPVRIGSSLLLTGLLLLTAAGQFGCQPVNRTVNPGYVDAQSPYPNIMISEDDLGRALWFSQPTVALNDAGFITRVDLSVRADSGNTLKVDYRPIFFDSNGMVLQPEPGWRTDFFEANVPEYLQLLPNGTSAVDFEVHFRWAR